MLLGIGRHLDIQATFWKNDFLKNLICQAETGFVSFKVEKVTNASKKKSSKYIEHEYEHDIAKKKLILSQKLDQNSPKKILKVFQIDNTHPIPTGNI